MHHGCGRASRRWNGDLYRGRDDALAIIERIGGGARLNQRGRKIFAKTRRGAEAVVHAVMSRVVKFVACLVRGQFAVLWQRD